MPLVNKYEIKLKALADGLLGKQGRNKNIGGKQYSEIEWICKNKCLTLKICNLLGKWDLIFSKQRKGTKKEQRFRSMVSYLRKTSANNKAIKPVFILHECWIRLFFHSDWPKGFCTTV